MWRRISAWGALLVLLAALISACSDDGGSESGEDTAGGDAAASPTETPVPTPSGPTLTPTPRPTFPPTWTAVPTLTQPPEVTIDYEYNQPTQPTFIPPTYTPSPEPPTPTPPGPELLLTTASLNALVNAELEEGSGGLYAEPPTISFQQNGVMIVEIDVLETPGDLGTARELRIRARLEVVEGRVNVVLDRANFTDNNAVYDDELVDNLLATIDTAINDSLIDLYAQSGADTSRFGVLDAEAAEPGITVQTVSLPDA